MSKSSVEAGLGDPSQKIIENGTEKGREEERIKEVEEVDFNNLLKVPAEAARELRSRLEGNSRGEIEIDGKKFSTDAISSLSLLFVLEQKDPNAAQTFLRETKEKREKIIEEEAVYINELFREFEGKSWPTVVSLLSELEGGKLIEIRDKFRNLNFRAGDILDKNGSGVINVLDNTLENIEDFFFDVLHGSGDIYKRESKQICRGFTSKLELANLVFQIFKRRETRVTSETDEVSSRETELDQKKLVEETSVYINELVEEFPDYWTGEAKLFSKEKINEIRNRFTDLMKRADTVLDRNLSRVIQRLDDILEDIDDRLPDNRFPGTNETDTDAFRYLYYRFARELRLVNLIFQMFKEKDMV